MTQLASPSADLYSLLTISHQVDVFPSEWDFFCSEYVHKSLSSAARRPFQLDALHIADLNMPATSFSCRDEASVSEIVRALSTAVVVNVTVVCNDLCWQVVKDSSSSSSSTVSLRVRSCANNSEWITQVAFGASSERRSSSSTSGELTLLKIEYDTDSVTAASAFYAFVAVWAAVVLLINGNEFNRKYNEGKERKGKIEPGLASSASDDTIDESQLLHKSKGVLLEKVDNMFSGISLKAPLSRMCSSYLRNHGYLKPLTCEKRSQRWSIALVLITRTSLLIVLVSSLMSGQYPAEEDGGCAGLRDKTSCLAMTANVVKKESICVWKSNVDVEQSVTSSSCVWRDRSLDADPFVVMSIVAISGLILLVVRIAFLDSLTHKIFLAKFDNWWPSSSSSPSSWWRMTSATTRKASRTLPPRRTPGPRRLAAVRPIKSNEPVTATDFVNAGVNQNPSKSKGPLDDTFPPANEDQLAVFDLFKTAVIDVLRLRVEGEDDQLEASEVASFRSRWAIAAELRMGFNPAKQIRRNIFWIIKNMRFAQNAEGFYSECIRRVREDLFSSYSSSSTLKAVPDILRLFAVDLIGRYSLSGMVFERLSSAQKEYYSPGLWKALAWLAIVGLNVYFVLVSFTLTRSRSESWDRCNLSAIIAALLLDGVYFEFAESFWRNFLAPWSISRGVHTAMHSIMQHIESNTWQVDSSAIDEDCDKSTFNATEYFFLSRFVAKKHPKELAASLVISYSALTLPFIDAEDWIDVDDDSMLFFAHRSAFHLFIECLQLLCLLPDALQTALSCLIVLVVIFLGSVFIGGPFTALYLGIGAVVLIGMVLVVVMLPIMQSAMQSFVLRHNSSSSSSPLDAVRVRPLDIFEMDSPDSERNRDIGRQRQLSILIDEESKSPQITSDSLGKHESYSSPLPLPLKAVALYDLSDSDSDDAILPARRARIRTPLDPNKTPPEKSRLEQILPHKDSPSNPVVAVAAAFPSSRHSSDSSISYPEMKVVTSAFHRELSSDSSTLSDIESPSGRGKDDEKQAPSTSRTRWHRSPGFYDLSDSSDSSMSSKSGRR